MKTMTQIQTNENLSEEASHFALKVGITFAVLVGLWGTACLFSGFLAAGSVSALAKSLFLAISI